MLSYMSNRTASLKLLTSPEQAQRLTALADAFSRACSEIVPVVVANRMWNRVALHHLSYYPVRELLPALGSQMVCQAVHRVADAYKTLKANGGIVKDKPIPIVTFTPTSIHYDKRTYRLLSDAVSLFTLDGRILVPLAYGRHQANLLASGTAKDARVIVRKGVWYFNLCLDIPDTAPVSGGAMGVDVGENNLAATSTGKVFGGGALCHKRDSYLAHRRRLQANGSRAAKRKLHAISGREQRHVKHVNHEVSKAIVTEAVRTGAGEIRLEDLTHIRDNIKAGHRVRTRLHRWAFRQLQDFTAYKANSAGLMVTYIDPAYTSKTCSVCGEIGQRVRHSFSCSCGARRHSDVNAALNIAGLTLPIGLVRGSHVTCPEFAHKIPSCVVESPRL